MQRQGMCGSVQCLTMGARTKQGLCGWSNNMETRLQGAVDAALIIPGWAEAETI
jgi:hypothetical protein